MIRVDDKLCISGIRRYNSKSHGAKKIIPTLIRALKLYGPKLEKSSLILSPPNIIIYQNSFQVVEQCHQTYWYYKEEFQIP